MSIASLEEEVIDIPFRSDYQKAVFSLFHVAYIDRNDHAYLPMEDKESIKEALKFYQQRILGHTYPVYDGKSFSYRDATDTKVLFQVLGIPERIFSTLDLSKDILSQLPFVGGTAKLKDRCYHILAKKTGKKWFSDEFRLFCLAKGFFFLYDETKPFMEERGIPLPVFIDEEKLSGIYLKLYQSADSSRFAIDILGKEDDEAFNQEMKRLDSFSLDRRIAYFVNHTSDREISDLMLDAGFKKRYESVLRKYVASLINCLYDDFSLNVIGISTGKLSFLTYNKIRVKRKVYSLSSYQADMYSLDNEHFFFANLEKERIIQLISEEYERNPKESILSFYARLGLPFEGFASISDLKDFTKEDVLSRLPFDDFPMEEIYLSCKRFDGFYSYLSSSSQHAYCFDRRVLFDQGIIYESLDAVYLRKDIPLTLKVEERSRDSMFSLFDEKRNLHEEILPSYEMVHGSGDSLRKLLKKIDEMSSSSALLFFYSLFSQKKTFLEAYDRFLKEYDIQESSSQELEDFLFYTLNFPFRIAEEKTRVDAILHSDKLTLVALDNLYRNEETYEPCLPSPYVTFYWGAYSFRKDYFSKPCLCSCQKEAVSARIGYFASLYDRFHTNGTPEEKNRYILDFLELPEDIEDLIDLSKDILPQIPFKDHVCHICNHATPSYYGEGQEDIPEKVFLTYIRSNAALKGLFYDGADNPDSALTMFFDDLKAEDYHCILHFDRKRIDPILLPYINVSRRMIASLIASFFPDSCGYDEFYFALERFLSLGDETIRRLLFECDKKDYPLIYQNLMIFTRLVYIYRRLELAYSLYVSQDIVSPDETGYSMNLDYNGALKHPFVHLGHSYCAYSDNPCDGKYYLCSCDKKSLAEFGNKYLELYEKKHFSEDCKTALILGLLGLPYLVVLKYSGYSLENHHIEPLLDKMDFENGICRKDASAAIASYHRPFEKSYPFQSDLDAEYDFAINGMMHDSFLILSNLPLKNIHFDPEYVYPLDMDGDDLLPVIDYPTERVPESIFTYFVMGKDKLKDFLYDFSLLNKGREEANAYASGIIMDTYFENDRVFLNFYFPEEPDGSLLDRVLACFPQTKRIRKEFMDAVIQQILGFMTYLCQKLIERYVLMEKHIGR